MAKTNPMLALRQAIKVCLITGEPLKSKSNEWNQITYF